MKIPYVRGIVYSIGITVVLIVAVSIIAKMLFNTPYNWFHYEFFPAGFCINYFGYIVDEVRARETKRNQGEQKNGQGI